MLWYGAHLIGTGSLTSGLLIAFLLYLDQFFSPLQQLSAVFDQWIQARISLGRLDELLATPSSTPEAGRPDRARRRGSATSPCEGVRFAYSPDAPEALRGVDLRIARRRDASPSSARPAPASRRSSSSSPASTTRPPGGCSSTASTCATSTCTRFRRHLGYVPQEPFLFSGHDPLEHRLRAPGRHRPRDRAGGAGGRRPRPRARRCPTATTRRWPRPAARCRPASASCCAWPGPQLVDPSDPDPRRGHVEPRPGHRGRGAAGDEPGVAGPHDAAHRPPPADGPQRRRASSSSRRAASSRTAATTSSSPPAAATPSCGTPSTAPRPRPGALPIAGE